MDADKQDQPQQQVGVSNEKPKELGDDNEDDYYECFCLQYKLTSDAQVECNEQLRRDLRKRQRQTLEDIQGNTLALKMEMSENTDGDKSINTHVIDEARTRNNNLFKRVRHTRELKHDADNLEALATMCVDQVHYVQKPSRYDPVRLVKVLKKKLTAQGKKEGTMFDWKQLGEEACICFNSLPARVSFLAGPLAADATGKISKLKKKKKKVKRRRGGQEHDDESNFEEVVQVEEIKNKQRKSSNKSGNEPQGAVAATKLCDAENHLKVLKKTLQAKCVAAVEDGNEPEIDMIPFLFSPQSFTQTIENILHFSHLVKKGIAGVRSSSSDGIVYIRYISHSHRCMEGSGHDHKEGGDGDGNSKALQAVLSLTMKDWRDLVKAYNLVEGTLPDRKYKRVTPLVIGSDDSDSESEEEEELVTDPIQQMPASASRNIHPDIEMEAKGLNPSTLNEGPSSCENPVQDGERGPQQGEAVLKDGPSSSEAHVQDDEVRAQEGEVAVSPTLNHEGERSTPDHENVILRAVPPTGYHGSSEEATAPAVVTQNVTPE